MFYLFWQQSNHFRASAEHILPNFDSYVSYFTDEIEHNGVLQMYSVEVKKKKVYDVGRRAY